MNRIQPYPTEAADGIANAIGAGLLGVTYGLETLWARHVERRHQRLALRQVRDLSDHLLRDIGLTRQDLA